jgi:hypothetical protein
LDAIKFTWGDEGKFLHFDYEKLVTSLANFVKIKGDMCVPPNFVMPATAQWETSVHGFDLGRQVNLCRAQRAMLEAEYPHRFQLLTNFGFLWLDPDLDTADKAQDAGDPTSANQLAVAAVLATQRDYQPDAVYWANNFYEEVLSPSEWLRLRAALEQGYVWRDALFGVEDMYDVELANPIEYSAEDLEDADDDAEEDDDDDDESAEVGDDDEEDDEAGDLLGGDVFEDEEDEDEEEIDDDDDDDDDLLGEDEDELDLDLPDEE